MIDTKELRRLAQEATSGEWYVVRGNHIYGRKKVTDGEEEWHPLIACTDDDEVNVNFEANASFIAAANPAAISELLDRLEAAEKDVALKEQVIDALGSELNAVANERDALRTKIEQMEWQEPVWFIDERGEPKRYHKSKADYCKYGGLDLLYALPGAKGEEK